MNRISFIARRALPVVYGGVLLGVATAAVPVAAHAVGEGSSADWHLTWSFEPWVIACLCGSASLYAVGVYRLWTHASRGRGVGAGVVAAFTAGWLALGVALVSPLDQLGAFLFSAHMVQHELLMIVAAPLLVLGRALAVWTWALPFSWRRAAGQFFHSPDWRVPWLVATGPGVAWALHALALWLWHVPALFEAALLDNAVHAAQHASFLFTALLFWWSLLGGPSRTKKGLALLSLFTTMVHTGALGALLTLARHPWYPNYVSTAPTYGLDALQDQQLGGIIMWVPAGLIYIGFGLVLGARWLSASSGADRKKAAGVMRLGDTLETHE